MRAVLSAVQIRKRECLEAHGYRVRLMRAQDRGEGAPYVVDVQWPGEGQQVLRVTAPSAGEVIDRAYAMIASNIRWTERERLVYSALN